jgi:hypothetical protein
MENPQRRKRSPYVICAAIVCLVVCWLIFWTKCITLVGNASERVVTPTNGDTICSSRNEINGTFAFGSIDVLVCDPYAKDQRTLVRINGSDAIETSDKLISNDMARWVDNCLIVGDKCCYTLDFGGMRFCFFPNGNVTLETNRGIFPLKSSEGKYLLHVLARNIS